MSYVAWDLDQNDISGIVEVPPVAENHEGTAVASKPPAFEFQAAAAT